MKATIEMSLPQRLEAYLPVESEHCADTQDCCRPLTMKMTGLSGRRIDATSKAPTEPQCSMHTCGLVINEDSNATAGGARVGTWKLPSPPPPSRDPQTYADGGQQFFCQHTGAASDRVLQRTQGTMELLKAVDRPFGGSQETRMLTILVDPP